jgi:2-polyprenyl-3-methyl-5-hydroxy-6-metoxy-1,4-benzoquinol methylase
LDILKNCPVCGHEQHTYFLSCKDFTVSQEKFSLVKCNNCDFCFTNPRPSVEEIGKYYQSEKYISHSNTKKGLFSILYQSIRQKTLKNKTNLIENLAKKFDFLPKNISILDYGCGTGEFLNTCQQKGWNIAGIEPSENARLQAEKVSKINIYSNIFNILLEKSKENFDFITLWHVLEHVHDLDNTIKAFYELLKKDGFLLIAVPNYATWEAEYYTEYWAGYDVPRHLYHFTPKTMNKLLEKFGFEVIQQYPMIYDAYYISLLSGQYKNGYKNYIWATLQGYLSNQHAHNNQGNYSSVLYICRKIINDK